MKIEGSDDGTSNKPVTIQMMKDRSFLYRETPAISIYID
jgi:hypothetical protein